MTSITLTAPAKVNLFLKVLNKRKNGYHNIVTLFERISIADEIRISKIPSGIKLKSDKFITANPRDNLAYKAAELILGYKGGDKGPKGVYKGVRIGVSRGEGIDRGLKGIDRGLKGADKGLRGVEIKLKKRIPVAAGLGGGSSDAASTLIGINKLYNLKLKDKELIKLAGKLGADVPFFIGNAPFAIGKGIGDKLTRACLGIRLWHLIIYPGFKLAARDVYEAFDSTPKDLTRDMDDVKISRLLADSGDLNAVESMLTNNLEDVAASKRPVIGAILERLASSLGKKAIVSGSGPSVFCLYGMRKEAIAAKKRLYSCVPAAQRKDWQVFVAGTLD